MPTVWYELIEKQNNHKRSLQYNQQAIQWLEYMSKTYNISIQHAENGDEYFINNFEVVATMKQIIRKLIAKLSRNDRSQNVA